MIVDGIFRAARFWRRFRNPVSVACARLLRSQGTVLLWDRATNVKCRARVGAHSIFTEVFHNHDYDVPGVSLGRGHVVLDIGGHQGFFACYAAHLGARVLSFEPDEASHSLLVENVARNGLADRVTAHIAAVAGKNGQATLLLTDAMGGGMNSTCPSYPAFVGNKVRESRIVPSVSLNHVVDEANSGSIRMCKIDVEGAELEILSALSQDRARRVECFVLEYHEPLAPLGDLARVILGWGTHQLCLAEDTETGPRRILRAVATRSWLGESSALP